MIMWLASYPRSGNTLLRIVLSDTMGIGSVSDEPEEVGGDSKVEIPAGGWGRFYEEAAHSDEVILLATHRPPPDSQSAIHIVRDGRSSLLSDYYFHKRFSTPPCPSLMELVLGADFCGGWSEHYRLWAQRANVLVVRYEQLVNADAGTLSSVARHIGYQGTIKPWTNQCEQLQGLDSDFFRKGNAVWEDSPLWTPAINAAFFHLHGDLMAALGYESHETVAAIKKASSAEWLETVDMMRRSFAEKKKLEDFCGEQQIVIDDLRQICDEREVLAQLPMLDMASASASVKMRQTFDAEINRLQAVGAEKDGVIEGLKQAADEREALIKKLSALCRAQRLNVDIKKERKWRRVRIASSVRNKINVRLHKIFAPHRYPKIGRLCHHDPISIQPWGMPAAGRPRRDMVWPSISIVTPSFRQASYITRTIESVLGQRYPALEYFIQDGGSQDGTVEILKHYTECLSGWTSEPDDGQSQAINRGFIKTHGEIMAWLNSDDLLMPGTLAYVAEYFVSHPDVDVVYGQRILIDEHDREIGRWILPPHDDKVLSWADFVPQETLFWRRTIWEKAGGSIDETFRFAMDWDLLLRFRKAGARMVRLPKFLGAFRIHEAQKTSAAINDVGHQEMHRLRVREVGREIDYRDIRRAIGFYAARHVFYDLAYRFGKRFRRGRNSPNEHPT